MVIVKDFRAARPKSLRPLKGGNDVAISDCSAVLPVLFIISSRGSNVMRENGPRKRAELLLLFQGDYPNERLDSAN